MSNEQFVVLLSEFQSEDDEDLLHYPQDNTTCAEYSKPYILGYSILSGH